MHVEYKPQYNFPRNIIRSDDVEYLVLVVTVINTIFWNVTPCNLMQLYSLFLFWKNKCIYKKKPRQCPSGKLGRTVSIFWAEKYAVQGLARSTNSEGGGPAVKILPYYTTSFYYKLYSSNCMTLVKKKSKCSVMPQIINTP
jgi:hypothetical protein